MWKHLLQNPPIKGVFWCTRNKKLLLSLILKHMLLTDPQEVPLKIYMQVQVTEVMIRIKDRKIYNY